MAVRPEAPDEQAEPDVADIPPVDAPLNQGYAQWAADLSEDERAEKREIRARQREARARRDRLND